MSGPNPELLAAYGTDEVYLAHLEKRAADTIFGPSTAAAAQGSFGRMIVGGRLHQERVDRFRADADAMNLRFKALEGQVMANTIENLGGPGTQRSMFTRSVMMQPYSVYPMLYANAVSPPSGGPANADAPGEAVEQRLGVDVNEEMARTASVSTAIAVRLGCKLAQMSSGYPMLPAPSTQPSIGQDFSQAGLSLNQGAMQLGRGATRAFGKAVGAAGGVLSGVGKGLERFMLTDRKPTPRWGVGIGPARDANQYGEPIY